MPAGVALLVELGGVALGDAFGQAAAVLLGPGGLGDQLVPVRWIRAQDLAIAHDQGDPIGMKIVLKELERPAEVALPAVRVAGQEEVEAARSEVVEHRGHRRRAPHGSTAVGDLVHEPGVDQAVPLDEPVLLLALARRAVAVVLAGRRLADPARRPETTDVVDRSRQRLHAAGFFWIMPMSDTFALASSPSRRSWSGPSG